jgi:glycopeptide antibiotics resistance protein
MVRRRVTITILFLYAVGVIALTVFPIRVHSAAYWADEPWSTMIHWRPGDVDGPSFLLNVIMFIPLGVLLPLLWPVLDTVRRLATCAAAASLCIELIQLVLGLTLGSRRTVDVNDLIANTGGALIGLLILRLALPSRVHRATSVAGRPPSPPPPA